MRIWSIHPSYLDTKGLLAVWREGLLALKVLQGQTKGYTQHPQLLRFKQHPQPIVAITAYLHTVVDEAERRNFSFKREKLEARVLVAPITLTTGQLAYETKHLKTKLLARDLKRHQMYSENDCFEAHPLFKVIPGDIETWEKSVIA